MEPLPLGHPEEDRLGPQGLHAGPGLDPCLLGSEVCWGLGRKKGGRTYLLLHSERLLCGQDDQQLLQGAPLNGLHLDLWVAVGGAQESMTLYLRTDLGSTSPAQ